MTTDNTDWLVGAREIAAYIRRSEKAAYHLLERKALPGIKFAGRWQARKSRIDRALDKLEEQQAEEALS
jgi:hypothetical protein